MRRAVAGEQADRPGAGDATVSPALMLPRRATCSAMLAGSMTAPSSKETESGSRKIVLHVVHDVGGVAALDVVPVLGVQAGLAVVLAEVVLALDALLADAAGVVAGARDAVADLPAEGLRAGAERHDLAGPLVAGREREGRGPEAGVVAVDQVGVGAADRRSRAPGRAPRSGPGSGTGFSWISRTSGSRTTRACMVSVIRGLPVGVRGAERAGRRGLRDGSGAVSPIIETRASRWARQEFSIIDDVRLPQLRRRRPPWPVRGRPGRRGSGCCSSSLTDSWCARAASAARSASRSRSASRIGRCSSTIPRTSTPGRVQRDERPGERAPAGRRRARARGSPTPRRSGGGSGRRRRSRRRSRRASSRVSISSTSCLERRRGSRRRCARPPAGRRGRRSPRAPR